MSVSDPRLRGCPLQPGTQLVLHYDPSPASQERTMRKAKHREPVPVEDGDEAVAGGDPVADVPQAGPTTAVVGVPAGADTLSQLLPVHGELGGLSLVLAVVAVLGGGAAWRFYSQRSRERHELAMRELELRAAGGQGQSPDCKADGAAWRSEVQRLEGRLTELEQQQQSSLGLSAGAGDLEDRIAKLEQAAKPARRGKAKP